MLPTCFLEAMGAQLILGAQQILMVLGAQGAQTMNCTKAEKILADRGVPPPHIADGKN